MAAVRFAEASPIPTALLDELGRVTMVNSAWQKDFGDSADQRWTTSLGPAAESQLETLLGQVRTSGGPVSALVAIVTPSRRTLRVYLAPLEDGVMIHAVAVPEEDIELRARAHLLGMSDREMQVGHWKLRTLRDELDWSDEVHRIHGTDPATFTPKLADGLKVYHPDDRENVARCVAHALETGEPYVFRARLFQPSGAIRYVRSAGQVNPHDPTELIGVFQDITDLVVLDQALAESETRLQLALRATQDGVWDWNPETDALWVSDRALTVLGVTRDAFAPTIEGWLARVYPDDRAELRQSLEGVRHGGGTFDSEFRIVVPGAQERWVRGRGRAGQESLTGPRRVVGALTDVTGKKIAQLRLLQQAYELRQRNSDLERFATVASHDLKEPIRKIQTFLSRVLDEEGVGTERSLNYLARARRSAERLHGMVGDLHEIARVSRDSRSRHPVDLEKAARDALHQLRMEGYSARPEIKIGPLPTIDANLGQMVQLFSNLFDNAVKYRSRDRLLSIRLTAREVKGGIELTLRDNGLGFDAAHVKRAFLLFEQLQGRHEFPGTGLGLALCARIMEEYGGAIYADPDVEIGASIVMSFPHSVVVRGMAT